MPISGPTLDTTTIALARIDRAGRYLHVNAALAALYGHRPEDMLGRSPHDLLPSIDAQHDLALLDAGKAVPDRDVEWRGRFYQASVTPVVGRDVVVGLAVSFTDITRHKIAERNLIEQNQRLEAQLNRDHLTGLLNRRGIDQLLDQELRRARELPSSLSLLMADIDFFKQYNDSYGHLAGDDCLRDIAAICNRNMRRSTDVACRFGGEEFIALLPNTPLSGALEVAERIRASVEAQNVPHAASVSGHITISIGVAAIPFGGRQDQWHLLEAADRALYQAKALGRNRVAAATREPETT